MGQLLIEIIWFFLPAGVANMVAAISRYLPILNYPVDFNKTFYGQPIFGVHKTYRGLFFGLLAAIIFVYLQRFLAPALADYNLVDYSRSDIWLFGLMMGLGAVLGDLARSFIKRRFGLPPGQPWFPWDQLDWIIGAIIFVYWYQPLSVARIVAAILIAVIAHPLVNYFCYLVKLQNHKF